MTLFVRDEATEARFIDRWAEGFGWMAHPEEAGQRASHAVKGQDGVWIIDPIAAPAIDQAITELGDVAGVAILSNWHTRDADRFASGYDVSIHIPTWMSRIPSRVEAPIQSYDRNLGNSGFRALRCTPFPGWREAMLYRPDDRTLVIPESLGTASHYLVDPERIGLELIRRPRPPRDLLDPVDPARILVGHGEGIFENASMALSEALDGGRRRFPRALVNNGITTMRALTAAMLA